MNILFLTKGDLRPNTNGVLRVTYNLANRFAHDGHNVHFMSVSNLHDATYPPLVADAHFPSQIILDRANFDFLQNYVDEKKIDIVINQIGTDRLMSQLFTSPKNCKIISVVHNDPWDLQLCYYYFYFKTFKGKLLAPLAPILKYRNIIRIERHYNELIKESDKVVLLSDFYKSRFNCLQSEKVLAIENAAPEPLSLTESISRKKQVIFVGRLYSAQKAPEYLVKAWSKIYSRFPDWELLILGDAPDKESLERLIVKKGGKKLNIKMMGFVDSAPFYKSASILGMTSRFEGWGMSIVEAMSKGCVPVSFKNEITHTLIDDNISGHIVKLFDTNAFARALSDLMLDKEKLQRFSKSAIEKSQQFSVDIIVEKWYKLFKDVLK